MFDCTFGSLEALRAELIAWRPDVVGISAMVSLTGATLRVAEAVREDLPQALLVAGGPLPTVFPRRFSDRVDAVFRGEADLAFPAFCRDYLAAAARGARCGSSASSATTGSSCADGTCVDVPPVHHSERRLRTFPIPDRSDTDHASYQAAWMASAGVRTTSLIASAGLSLRL